MSRTYQEVFTSWIQHFNSGQARKFRTAQYANHLVGRLMELNGITWLFEHPTAEGDGALADCVLAQNVRELSALHTFGRRRAAASSICGWYRTFAPARSGSMITAYKPKKNCGASKVEEIHPKLGVYDCISKYDEEDKGKFCFRLEEAGSRPSASLRGMRYHILAKQYTVASTRLRREREYLVIRRPPLSSTIIVPSKPTKKRLCRGWKVEKIRIYYDTMNFSQLTFPHDTAH